MHYAINNNTITIATRTINIRDHDWNRATKKRAIVFTVYKHVVSYKGLKFLLQFCNCN